MLIQPVFYTWCIHIRPFLYFVNINILKYKHEVPLPIIDSILYKKLLSWQPL